MIRYLKVGDNIYENVDTKIVDEKIIRDAVTDDNTGELFEPPVVQYDIVSNPLVPQDFAELKNVVIDTLSWLIGQSVKSTTGSQDFTKLSASNSKGIVLIAKLLDSLNPDTSVLSESERSAFEKMLQLADSGYADSELLNRSLESVMTSIQKYSALIEQATQAQSVDELVSILESL